MSEALANFLAQRLREVDLDAERLDAQMRGLEDERAQLERAGRAAGLDHLFDYNAAEAAAEEAAQASARRSGKVASERTIKEAVVELLAEAGRGMTALDILAGINGKFGFDYPRTSLSPQLSRLKNEGKIARAGLVWTLTDMDKPRRFMLHLRGGDVSPQTDEAAGASEPDASPAASVPSLDDTVGGAPPAQGREAGPGGGG